MVYPPATSKATLVYVGVPFTYTLNVYAPTLSPKLCPKPYLYICYIYTISVVGAKAVSKLEQALVIYIYYKRIL